MYGFSHADAGYVFVQEEAVHIELPTENSDVTTAAQDAGPAHCQADRLIEASPYPSEVTHSFYSRSASLLLYPLLLFIEVPQ